MNKSDELILQKVLSELVGGPQRWRWWWWWRCDRAHSVFLCRPTKKKYRGTIKEKWKPRRKERNSG